MISRHRLGTAETTFKALWKKTHHPDNYTHVGAFLASLQTNGVVSYPGFAQLY